jgi:hypothetical protein
MIKNKRDIFLVLYIYFFFLYKQIKIKLKNKGVKKWGRFLLQKHCASGVFSDILMPLLIFILKQSFKFQKKKNHLN